VQQEQGHILCREHITETERGTEVTGRRERRRRQLLDDLRETGGYCKLKEDELHRILWTTRFGRGCGPVVRQTVECNGQISI
jgi:hypothetical protein